MVGKPSGNAIQKGKLIKAVVVLPDLRKLATGLFESSKLTKMV